MSEPLVVHINDKNEVLGYVPKMEAHEKGLLHRAFSVLLFNSKGEWLIHRRALDKYHSPGLWTNTCCSHPFPSEATSTAAHRRLEEEMGMKCKIEKLFSFTYKAEFDNGLTEHEYDQVFIGFTDVKPVINKEEVCDWRYVSQDRLAEEINNYPENFTEWFKILFPKAVEEIRKTA